MNTKKNYSNQNLSFIPEEVFEIENLQELDVSYNQIQVGEYENLNGIFDKFDGVSEKIVKLSELEKLDLKHNQIKKIPKYIAEINSLKYLDLSSNTIEKIPSELLNFTNLQTLNIANNPVSQIKGFSLKESPLEIIEFLLLNQNKELISLNEAKLLIVGDENSGKSSLVERMVKNKFNSEYNSTEGIDISNYPISNDMFIRKIKKVKWYAQEEQKLKEKSILTDYQYFIHFFDEKNEFYNYKYRINIWDFAGQEITYQVHNLFMSKESLYLLVIDGQKEDNIVENFDWLETISANADNPPIIVVVTKHENNRSHEIDEDKYREKFTNIEAIHYVSSKENIGFCELKRSILLSISRFGKQRIPKEYNKVKNKIDEKKEKKLKQNKYMLSADEFDEICQENGLFDERDNIRTIFNDIGVLIGLDNDDMHVVNPSKMIDKIYEIVRSKDINDHGELDLEKKNDRHYTWIMKFFLKNKIAFQLDNSKVMIPSRLSVKRPKKFSKNSYMREDKVYGLNFRYRYKRFKKSIFFDFLIQALNIHDIKSTYWANGIFWNFDEFRVVVLASKVDRTIDIHISKETEDSKVFLTKIRKILDVINSEYRGVIEEIGVVDESDNILHYKNYQFLKAKERKKERTKNSDVELDIRGNPKDFPLLPLLEKYVFVEETIENDNKEKPLVLTEGKTDIRILEIAWNKLYPNIEIPFRMQDAGVKRKDKNIDRVEKSGGAEVLKKQLEYLTESNYELIIGVFDNDHKGIREFRGLQSSMFGKLSKNQIKRKHSYSSTYAILLPVPDFRINFISVDKIEFKLFAIEHYFSDEILSDYKMMGEPIIIKGAEIFEIKGNKDNFSKAIRELKKEEFKHFELFFKLINTIIEEDKEEGKINIQELIDSYDKDTARIIQAMQNGSIENFENIKIELAEEVKKLMQQSVKTWGKAKQKALERKEYIEGLLK